MDEQTPDAVAEPVGKEPAQPAPEPVVTAAASADDAAGLLDGLDERPVEEHPDVFAAVDETLTAQLGALDDLD